MCLCNTTLVHFVISTRCPLICPSCHNCNKKKSQFSRDFGNRLLLCFLSRGKRNTKFGFHLLMTTLPHKYVHKGSWFIIPNYLIVKRINTLMHLTPSTELMLNSSMCSPTLLYAQFPSLSALLHERAKCWQRLHWDITTVRASSNYKTTAKV